MPAARRRPVALPPKAVSRLARRVRPAQLLMLLACLAVASIALVLPLLALFSKAFQDRGGDFVGLANYAQYFNSPSLSSSVLNTLDISFWSTLVSVTAGFAYAYGLTRTNLRGKSLFRYVALIPIFIPTLVHALGLVYLFGRQGILTRAGLASFELYGRLGIILSEIIFTFPQAFLMFYVALGYSDGRLYEAADAMGVSALGKLRHITLPEIKYTVINAFFACFTLAFTDFGAPKVIGGSYNVLATDIYKQVAGQFKLNMGAVVGTLLLLPAVISFVVDRLASSANAGTLNAKATQLSIPPSRRRDWCFFAFCSLVSLCFLALVGALAVGALSRFYPYDMSLSLESFRFNPSTGGLGSYLNSLWMSLLTAVFGTAFSFVYAYMVEKTEGWGALRRYGQLLGVLPLAIPGMVIGLAFIFFFNARANPLNFIYGSMAILVLANVLHFFSVPYLTASGALKKLDREYEGVGDSLGVPRWQTFLKVSLPLSLAAVLEIFMYYFVNSMVTVSAVVFLYSADFRVASIAITHMEEAGDIGQAAAMSLLILAVNVAVRVAYEVVVRLLRARSDRREAFV